MMKEVGAQIKYKKMKKHTDLLGFEVLDENVIRKQIRQVIKEASCRQKSQELADSYSVEELQSRLDQIMMDMEQEAEPEGGPIADMYADEMDAYEGALRIAKGSSGTPLTYDQAIGRVSRDDFEKSSEFDKDKWEDDFDKRFPSLGEQDNFDSRLAQQMDMSDDEFEDQVASRDIESPFPGTDDDVSNGYKAAQALKDELRYVTYKKLSDEELDTFSKEMMLHFIENTTAQAAAKIWFGKKGL